MQVVASGGGIDNDEALLDGDDMFIPTPGYLDLVKVLTLPTICPHAQVGLSSP